MDEKVKDIFEKVLHNRNFTKMVFSKPKNKTVIKTEARLFGKSSKPEGAGGKAKDVLVLLQLTHFKTDNKAVHENIGLDTAAGRLAGFMEQEYDNCVIIAPEGNCDIKKRTGGGWKITDKLKTTKACAVPAHDVAKNLPLSDTGKYSVLLHALGLADSVGGIFPTKRNKYNQINRFIEVLDSCLRDIGATNVNIVDLCCGKAYLSLMAHNWLELSGRPSRICGIDSGHVHEKSLDFNTS